MSSVTERRGTIGSVKGSGENEVFQPKANFCLKIVAKVEGTKDGYIARVTRAPTMLQGRKDSWIMEANYCIPILYTILQLALL